MAGSGDAGVHPARVAFASEGIELAGDLWLPEAGGAAPAVAVTGPFTGVKDQVSGVYAARLAAAGIAALAFDHRGFGQSGGRRGHEDSQGKLADLRSAVSFLADQPEVDPARIGLVGVCLGGGYAMRAAAADPRVKAVAGVAGGYNSPAQFAESMGVAAYRSALASFLSRYDEYLPAVAPPDGGEAAMPGAEPYAYYGTERSASVCWENRATWGSLHSLMTFDALGAADLLGATPLLVHGRTDAYCSPDLAAELHRRATGEKEIVWLDCAAHIDLYDTEPYLTQATAAAARFLLRHL